MSADSPTMETEVIAPDRRAKKKAKHTDILDADTWNETPIARSSGPVLSCTEFWTRPANLDFYSSMNGMQFPSQDYRTWYNTIEMEDILSDKAVLPPAMDEEVTSRLTCGSWELNTFDQESEYAALLQMLVLNPAAPFSEILEKWLLERQLSQLPLTYPPEDITPSINGTSNAQPAPTTILRSQDIPDTHPERIPHSPPKTIPPDKRFQLPTICVSSESWTVRPEHAILATIEEQWAHRVAYSHELHPVLSSPPPCTSSSSSGITL
jgi:hypothetical protein